MCRCPHSRAAAKRGANLSGMMAVVIDDGNAAHYAFTLEAPIDTAIVVEPFGDLLRRNFKLARDCHGGCRVQNVVTAGNMQFKRAERSICRVHRKTSETQLTGRSFARRQKLQPVIGVLRFAVGEHTATRTRQNAFQQWIVDARGNRAIERNAVHEIQKGALHVVHVVVAVHMLAVEIGHHGENRRKLEERTVALIGFGYQVLRGAKSRVRTQRIYAAANDNRRIESAGT